MFTASLLCFPPPRGSTPHRYAEVWGEHPQIPHSRAAMKAVPARRAQDKRREHRVLPCPPLAQREALPDTPRRGGGSEGTGTTPPSLAASRLSAGLKAGEAGPATGKGGNTFLLPPQLFPLVAGVHGGVAGGGFELQVPQAHEGVEETPRQSQSRAIPTPRAAAAAAGTADPAGSGSAPAARCPSAGSRLALPRHPRSARPAPRRPLAPAAAAQQPPPPPPPPAPTRRSLSAAAPGRRGLGTVLCGDTAWRVLGCDTACSARRWRSEPPRGGREGGNGRAPLSRPAPPPPPARLLRPSASGLRRYRAVPETAGLLPSDSAGARGPSLARLARPPASASRGAAVPVRPWSVRDAGNCPGRFRNGRWSCWCRAEVSGSGAPLVCPEKGRRAGVGSGAQVL